MPEKKLNDLFQNTLKDICFAERQILKALPKMAKAARSDELRNPLTTHRDETDGHVERVISRSSGGAPRLRPARPLRASSKKDEIIEEHSGSEALDAGLLASAQRSDTI